MEENEKRDINMVAMEVIMNAGDGRDKIDEALAAMAEGKLDEVDKLLEEAVDFCRQHGVEFYAVNTNYPEEQEAHQHFSRKLKADVFIDDRNLGGMLNWGSIYRIIHYRLKIADLVAETLDERLEEGIERRKQEKKKRQGLFGKLFG